MRHRVLPVESLFSPVGTAEFSHGRQPAESHANHIESRVAATERGGKSVCRRYAAAFRCCRRRVAC
jgi:hypothetical protein